MTKPTGNYSNKKKSSAGNELPRKDINVPMVPDEIIRTLESRKTHMCLKEKSGEGPSCNSASVPGMVTQRSCVYGGARVVLMPITDAAHLVHGPIGCSACTWDIRGSRSSGDDLFKTGFSTNLEEKDIVFGGETKLRECILEISNLYHPSAIFVYSTCVVGLIGDDIKSICRETEHMTGCRVIPVQSEGFRSFNKSLGHQLACEALLDHLIGTGSAHKTTKFDVNILGEFNVAGDLWAIQPLLEQMGVNIIATLTGDSKVEEIAGAHQAQLNLVQCQKSSNYLAQMMEEKYGIRKISVNFFGLEETAQSLQKIAQFFQDPQMMNITQDMIQAESRRVKEAIQTYRARLQGKRVAVYVGGNKAWSLIRAFEELGMQVIMTGTQNGLPEDYQRILDRVQEGTLIVDDANVLELSRLIKKYQPDLVVSGAKEKYLVHKLGVPFCEFNHDRITAFAGFDGFLNFARDVDRTVSSPVWNLTPNKLRSLKEMIINE